MSAFGSSTVWLALLRHSGWWLTNLPSVMLKPRYLTFFCLILFNLTPIASLLGYETLANQRTDFDRCASSFVIANA